MNWDKIKTGNISEKEKLRESLHFDPLAGDDGERIFLSDKIVRGKKDYECSHCIDIIYAGELHRVLTDKFDGAVGSYRYCKDCCNAMTIYLTSGNIKVFSDRQKY